MRIEQTDVANLSDNELRRLVLALCETADEHGGPLGDFWRAVAVAVVRAVRGRARALAWIELDLDDTEGALVDADTDPVADALDELRHVVREVE